VDFKVEVCLYVEHTVALYMCGVQQCHSRTSQSRRSFVHYCWQWKARIYPGGTGITCTAWR